VLGILVDNGRLRHRTNVERVLFVYSFHAFEKAAVKVALELAHDPRVHLTIVVPRQAPWLATSPPSHHDYLQQQQLESVGVSTLDGLLQLRQRAESDTTVASSTSDDDDQTHNHGKSADGSKPTKKKGPAWYEYFDIVFLLRLLVRLVRSALRRIVAPGSSAAGAPRKGTAHGGQSPMRATSSLPLGPSEDALEMAERHTPDHPTVRQAFCQSGTQA
jgi:hypothetical protein